MATTATKQETYQPFTSPITKNAKCFAGKTVLIHPDAQQSVDKLPSGVKQELNNKMSCIATTNISSVGRSKLYIETMSGLLEFVVSRKANRTETMIEQVRYLKGLRKPWQGQIVSLTNRYQRKDGRFEFNSYYTKPIFSYPDEKLRDFLLRVTPLFVKLTNSNHQVGSDSFKSKAEFTSAIFESKGSVKQFSLILETQALPHLSVSTRKPPAGFRIKKNPVNGQLKSETIHTHGDMGIDRKFEQRVNGVIHFYGGDEKNQEKLKYRYIEKYKARSRGIRRRVGGDMDDFSELDYEAPGWLVTDEVCLKYQHGDDTDKTMGCIQ